MLKNRKNIIYRLLKVWFLFIYFVIKAGAGEGWQNWTETKINNKTKPEKSTKTHLNKGFDDTFSYSRYFIFIPFPKLALNIRHNMPCSVASSNKVTNWDQLQTSHLNLYYGGCQNPERPSPECFVSSLGYCRNMVTWLYWGDIKD